MLLSQFIKDAIAALGAVYSAREARAVADALCEDLLGFERHSYLLNPSLELSASEEMLLSQALKRLLGGEPLQYVTGKAWFRGRAFRVGSGVLIPRPETEMIVEAVVSRFEGRGPRILDLCTGSGCIAWSLAFELPGAELVGVDISDDALNIASTQTFSSPSGAFRAPSFVKEDILSDDFLSAFPPASFDVIVSNPPYIMESQKKDMDRNVLDFEPGLALFVPDSDPMVFYRAIARAAARLLRPGGLGAVEINEDLGRETLSVFTDAGFTNVSLHSDFLGKPRLILFSEE